MYEPADNEQTNVNTDPEQQSSGGYSGDTDRVNGEYHYKNGYTQKIYSDAHYVPENENTVPPRYYTPPEKPVKAPKEKKPHGKWVKALCMCLVCALLGGVCGAGIMAGSMNSRIAALEEKLEEQTKEALSIGQTSTTPAPVSTTTAAKPIASIYDQACNEVVGITTEVTYTNFFGQTSSSAVSGSGFIVSSDGYILTNYHVIEYAYKGNYAVTVMLHDGTRYEASIVGVEDCNDIAVLKIDASGLDPVTFGDSDKLSVGDDVYAVGNPLGELEFSMTTGHVSALDRLITTDESSEAINMFQIDAAVNSGNSGGPVYNANGEVVGIVTAKYSDTGVEGLGFAIPINDAAKIANDLITKGYVTGKAYMGVSIDERYNSMYSQYYNMPIGAFVKSVESGSCAENAGIQAGDIITRLGDVEITGYSDLKQAIKQYSAGDSAELELYRAGESRTITVIFDEAVPDSANP
ncbi:MAG: S1C family serine protease [Candidatus Limivicinus sp.]